MAGQKYGKHLAIVTIHGVYGLRGNNWGAHHKFLPFSLFKK
jgi:hypothetical protein